MADAKWSDDSAFPYTDEPDLTDLLMLLRDPSGTPANGRTALEDVLQAALVSIVDAGGLFTATDVEGALAEAKDVADTANATADDALPKAGGQMSGTLDMGANPIENMADPTNDTDAATKQYVDGAISDIASGATSIAASLVPITDAGGHYTSTDVEGALAEAGVVITDPELAAIAGLTSAANKIIRFTGSGSAGLLDFKDEDNMSSNSDTALPSQQSVKAYADAQDLAYFNFAQAVILNGPTLTTRLSGTQTLAAGLSVNTTSGTATWTLPSVSGNTNTVCRVKNAGTGNLTVQRAGSDNLYTTTTVTSYILAPGDSAMFVCDGTYWQVIA